MVGYSCFICGASTQKDENWYDKWGIKCTICQDAINRKKVEWISLNRSLLELYRISGFLWVIKDLDIGTGKEILLEVLL